MVCSLNVNRFTNGVESDNKGEVLKLFKENLQWFSRRLSPQITLKVSVISYSKDR